MSKPKGTYITLWSPLDEGAVNLGMTSKLPPHGQSTLRPEVLIQNIDPCSLAPCVL